METMGIYDANDDSMLAEAMTEAEHFDAELTKLEVELSAKDSEIILLRAKLAKHERFASGVRSMLGRWEKKVERWRAVAAKKPANGPLAFVVEKVLMPEVRDHLKALDAPGTRLEDLLAGSEDIQW